MNLQSEDTTGIECLRRYPKSFYIHGSNGEVVNPNITRFDQRDNEQHTDTLRNNNYNNDQLYCDKFNTTGKFIIPPSRYTQCTLNEQRNMSTRSSFESICSRYLHTDIKHPPRTLENSKTEIRLRTESKSNLREDISKPKYDIHSEVAFTKSPDELSEKLPGKQGEKICFDKTTYCRPVTNIYNQELLYKTMVKNSKLRRLVTQLSIARQKEKEIENWNNYINDLKRKHNIDAKLKLTNSLQFISDNYTSRTIDTIEDTYNTKFMCKHSSPCQSLLQDLYNPHEVGPINYNDSKFSHECGQTPSYNPYKTNRLCFPTSSQGRFIVLERERMKRLTNRGYKPLFKTINEEKKLENDCLKISYHKGMECSSKMSCVVRNSRSTNTALQCTSTQTEFQITLSKSEHARKSKGCNTNHVEYKKGSSKDVRNKETGPETYYNTYNNLKTSSLTCIEEKLDNLIHSINIFITEMKTKSAQHKNFNQYTKLGKRNVNYTRSDICSMARKEKNMCGLIDDSSGTTRNSSADTFNRIQTIDENLTKINDILLKGIRKNQLITLKTSSVGETYPCSVQISVTIPTREISTEVTRSLSQAVNIKNRNIIIEEIPKSEDSRIAIAVNTDPLSLLAMLRVSTEETIRRILSYVPTIDYYSYLSRLQGPSHGVVESQYVCNICGAAFRKPSALTDHIQRHELGITRDCCVCRHVLDVPRKRPRLFKCQYCGQRFTRAYCCELHQESCARRLGKLHDVPSSLMLLR